jgi:hypothetical protein
VQLRLKPQTGVVEVDIPINTDVNYDHRKGAQLGEAMRRSRIVRGGGSYGMSGGFSEAPVGSGLKVEGERELGEGGEEEERLAVQTLGGRVMHGEEGGPVYFLGVFHEGESGLILLRGSGWKGLC